MDFKYFLLLCFVLKIKLKIVITCYYIVITIRVIRLQEIKSELLNSTLRFKSKQKALNFIIMSFVFF